MRVWGRRVRLRLVYFAERNDAIRREGGVARCKCRHDFGATNFGVTNFGATREKK
jgi:hypothetical protein